MIELRKLLFSKRLKQREILQFANRNGVKKRLHQSRLSRIVAGTLNPTEDEKSKIRKALFHLGIDDGKILKVRELVSEARKG